MAFAKVLLVDDTRLFLELEKSFLKHSFVQVLTAMNGQEALQIARQEKPDLIFMDVNMPGMNGIDCCAAIKQDPDTAEIPVIMLTTAGRSEDIELCRQAGCDDHLTKPVERRIFLDKGRKFLPAIDRRELRIACRTKVTIQTETGPVACLSYDLSISGIFVVTDQLVDQETWLELSFTLPGDNPLTIETKGRVAWLNTGRRIKPDQPEGFGVEFLELGKPAAEALQAFVEKNHVRR